MCNWSFYVPVSNIWPFLYLFLQWFRTRCPSRQPLRLCPRWKGTHWCWAVRWRVRHLNTHTLHSAGMCVPRTSRLPRRGTWSRWHETWYWGLGRHTASVCPPETCGWTRRAALLTASPSIAYSQQIRASTTARHQSGSRTLTAPGTPWHASSLTRPWSKFSPQVSARVNRPVSQGSQPVSWPF